MRVMGIDPGLTRCGVGVIDVQRRHLSLVRVHVARTTTGEPLEVRLLHIAQEIETMLAQLQPDVVAVERVYMGQNVSTMTATSQVAGLAMVAAARERRPVALHTPAEVKAAVSGYGAAPKTQVQEMVRRILQLSHAPKPADAADALALAITHVWRGRGAATDRGNHTTPAGQSASTMTPAQRRWAEARTGADRARRAVTRSPDRQRDTLR